jgi:hypothetical protein
MAARIPIHIVALWAEDRQRDDKRTGDPHRPIRPVLSFVWVIARRLERDDPGEIAGGLNHATEQRAGAGWARPSAIIPL